MTDEGGYSERMIIRSNGDMDMKAHNIKDIADPMDAQDATTKAYVDNILLSFALATIVDTSKTLQGLLNAGVAPTTILATGIDSSHFIGLNHEGGLIFYMRADGTGLVAAPTDAPTTLSWGNSGGLGVGCNNFGTNADSTGIGYGATNTMTVLNAACDSTGSAFHYVDTLSLDGYADWFLPSRDELYEMYKNLQRYKCSAAPPGGTESSACTTSLGGFASSFYWSSTEFGTSFAWIQNFFNGNWSAFGNDTIKDSLYRVRAIRAF